MLITKFLLRVLPIILFSAAIFFVGLVYFERQQMREDNRIKSADWAKNDAALLIEPLWNLDEDAVINVLKAQLQRPRIHCIRLKQLSSAMQPNIDQGECQNAFDFLKTKTSVIYTSPATTNEIGELEHWIDISPTRDELIDKLYPLLLMLVVLVLVFVVCVAGAFRTLILLPLNRVSKSIAIFSQEGRREPAKWDTNDELGLLIKKYNQGLLDQELSEAELKQSVEQTQKALQDLQCAQKSLIEAEKLASLGSLVAGIAHEINTPIGSSLTVATAVSGRTKAFKKEVTEGALRKSMLLEFIDGVEEAGQILQRSLTTAADLIQSFKQVAVDQTSCQRRQFALKDTVEEVLSTLRPYIKNSQIQLKLNLADDIKMDSYPGPLGQVITNLFTNALHHAFEQSKTGTLAIHADFYEDNQVQMRIIDNGCGMTSEQLSHVFEPFFTTKLGKGGSGLGMHLVYNITTGLLGGFINIESEPGVGTRVTLLLPLVAPQHQNNNGGKTNAD